jgi:hypothetical protein
MNYDQLRQLSFPELLSLLESTIKHAQEYATGRDWSPGAATLMPPPALLEIGDFDIRARFPGPCKESSLLNWGERLNRIGNSGAVLYDGKTPLTSEIKSFKP